MYLQIPICVIVVTIIGYKGVNMKNILLAISIIILLSSCTISEKTEVDSPAPNKLPTESPKKEVVMPSSSISPIFNVKEIVGKDEKQLDKLLDKPKIGNLRAEDRNQESVTNYYVTKAGNTSVTFIGGKMAQISVELQDDFKYPDDANKAMRTLGLQAENLNTTNGNLKEYIRYSGIDGFYAIKVYSGMPNKPERIREVKIVVDGTL